MGRRRQLIAGFVVVCSLGCVLVVFIGGAVPLRPRGRSARASRAEDAYAQALGAQAEQQRAAEAQGRALGGRLDARAQQQAAAAADWRARAAARDATWILHFGAAAAPAAGAGANATALTLAVGARARVVLRALGAVAVRARANGLWLTTRAARPEAAATAAVERAPSTRAELAAWHARRRWPLAVRADGTLAAAAEARLVLIAVDSEAGATALADAAADGAREVGGAPPRAVARRALAFWPEANAWLACVDSAPGEALGARLVATPLPPALAAAAAARAPLSAAALAPFVLRLTVGAAGGADGRVALAIACAAPGGLGALDDAPLLNLELLRPMHLRARRGAAADDAAGPARFGFELVALDPLRARDGARGGGLGGWLPAAATGSPPRDCAAAAPARAGSARALRLLHWNVRDGFADELERLQRFESFVRRARVDVVTLNELNGWDERGARALGRRLGLAHAAFFEAASGYHLALLSARPLAPVLASSAQPLHHGVLVVDVRLRRDDGADDDDDGRADGDDGAADEGGVWVRLCVTHLSPASARVRHAEAAAIARLQAAEPRVPFLIVGDLNTLSPLDAREHAAARLRDALAASAPLASKFLGRDGAIAYEPMGALLDAGFADLGHGASAAEHSVPTLLNSDAMHAARMRLDYALANGALRARCACAAAALLRGDEASALSDHFPLLVALSGCAPSDAPRSDGRAARRAMADIEAEQLAVAAARALEAAPDGTDAPSAMPRRDEGDAAAGEGALGPGGGLPPGGVSGGEQPSMRRAAATSSYAAVT